MRFNLIVSPVSKGFVFFFCIDIIFVLYPCMTLVSHYSDRTAEIRKESVMPCRHLGLIQMTADTAVIVRYINSLLH
jgi:hypothetical protein